jgi:hypothetical protein
VTRLHTAAIGGFFAALGALWAIVATSPLAVPVVWALWQHRGFAVALGAGAVVAASGGAALTVRRAKANGIVSTDVSSEAAAIGAVSGVLAGVLIGFSHRLVAVLPYHLYSGWSSTSCSRP